MRFSTRPERILVRRLVWRQTRSSVEASDSICQWALAVSPWGMLLPGTGSRCRQRAGRKIAAQHFDGGSAVPSPPPHGATENGLTCLPFNRNVTGPRCPPSGVRHAARSGLDRKHQEG